MLQYNIRDTSVHPNIYWGVYKSRGLSNCQQKGGCMWCLCAVPEASLGTWSVWENDGRGSVRFDVTFGLCLVTFSSIGRCVVRWAFYSITLVRDSRWMVQCKQYELAGECSVGSKPWKIVRYNVRAQLATYTCESTFVCMVMMVMWLCTAMSADKEGQGTFVVWDMPQDVTT